MLQPGKTSLRWKLSRWFDDDAAHGASAARLFNLFLAILIVGNVITVILETVEPIRDRFSLSLAVAEHVATAVFCIEYALRLWTAVDLRDPLFAHPLWGRLRYMRSAFAIVDLVAVLPALLGFLGAGDLRVLRLLRLLRMLKLTRHSKVFSLLWAVFREEAPTIGALIFILSLTLTISGTLAYMVEGEEQPAAFNSIPAAMWWAIETLTTVGYGDMVPTTVVGKILGGVVSVVGIATLALFSGTITVGFLDQLRIGREQTAAGDHSARNGAPGERIAGETSGTSRCITAADDAGDRRIDPPASAALVETCPCCGRPLPKA